MPEDQARGFLMEELQEFQARKGKPGSNVTLFGDLEENIEKLKRYLNGELTVAQLKISEELAGAEDISPKDERAQELQKAKGDYITAAENLMKLVGRAKKSIERADPRLITLETQVYDLYTTILRDTEERLDKITDTKQKAEEYRKATQKMRDIIKDLEKLGGNAAQ